MKRIFFILYIFTAINSWLDFKTNQSKNGPTGEVGQSVSRIWCPRQSQAQTSLYFESDIGCSE